MNSTRSFPLSLCNVVVDQLGAIFDGIVRTDNVVEGGRVLGAACVFAVFIVVVVPRVVLTRVRVESDDWAKAGKCVVFEAEVT